MGGKACCFPPNNSFKNNFLSLCMLSCFSHVWLFVTLWTVAHQAPLFMGFSGKTTGVSCHFLLQGIFFPTQGLNPWLMSPASTGRFSLAPPERVDIFTVNFNDKSPWWPKQNSEWNNMHSLFCPILNWARVSCPNSNWARPVTCQVLL